MNCSATRSEGHDWQGCRCARCGLQREHVWAGYQCARCKRAVDLDADQVARLGSEGYDVRQEDEEYAVEEREPCMAPTFCYGACSACSSDPRMVTRRRTRITVSKPGAPTWTTYLEPEE